MPVPSLQVWTGWCSAPSPRPHTSPAANTAGLNHCLCLCLQLQNNLTRHFSSFSQEIRFYFQNTLGLVLLQQAQEVSQIPVFIFVSHYVSSDTFEYKEIKVVESGCALPCSEAALMFFNSPQCISLSQSSCWAHSHSEAQNEA